MSKKDPINLEFPYKVGDILLYKTIDKEDKTKFFYQVGRLESMVYAPHEDKLKSDGIRYFVVNPIVGLAQVKSEDIVKKM